MMAHATKLIVGGTIGQMISYGRVAPSPPTKKSLFLSPGLNIATQSKSPPCPANLRISPPPKKGKKKNVFCLYYHK